MSNLKKVKFSELRPGERFAYTQPDTVGGGETYIKTSSYGAVIANNKDIDLTFEGDDVNAEVLALDRKATE